MAEQLGKFSRESKHRTYRIVANDTTFWVNGHFLGEISSFFDVAFFGEFAEAREKLITLEGETAKDVALFLDIVHPGGTKEVTEKSCGTMMRYSDIWDIPSLREKCHQFLLFGFPRLRPSFDTTFALLETAYTHGFEHSSEQLISRLAGFGQMFLDQQGMLHKIADARTVAALFSAAPKEKIVVKKFNHSFSSIANKATRECVILQCTNRPSHVCSACKVYLCNAHQDAIPCTKDSQFPNFVKIVPFNIGSAKVDTELLYGTNSTDKKAT
ncbi:hypothetical protein Q1695_014048 [Nippostrongylus brasiliensis]|nr:hypothetical protein Q1695_014048 [Nippostrongylus brasiliensis]